MCSVYCISYNQISTHDYAGSRYLKKTLEAQIQHQSSNCGVNISVTMQFNFKCYLLIIDILRELLNHSGSTLTLKEEVDLYCNASSTVQTWTKEIRIEALRLRVPSTYILLC